VSFDSQKLDMLIKNQKNNEAISFLKNYCENNPNDYDAKINHVVLMTDIPWIDENDGKTVWLEDEMYQIVEELLSFEEYIAKAIIIKTIIELLFSFVSKDTYNLTSSYLVKNSSKAPYYGEILICKILYLEFAGNDEELQTLLLQSIDISPNYALNYIGLGDLMLKQKKISKAHEYYGKALKNTLLIDDTEYIPPYSFTELTSQLITQTKCYSSDYNMLLEKYEQTMGQKSFMKKILKRLQTLLKRRNR
jgi:tetratricopeptide (TPR) repeat protein